jgi:hypothetical protein
VHFQKLGHWLAALDAHLIQSAAEAAPVLQAANVPADTHIHSHVVTNAQARWLEEPIQHERRLPTQSSNHEKHALLLVADRSCL